MGRVLDRFTPGGPMFRTRNEWEGFYEQRDPWGYVGQWLLERRRQEIMKGLFEKWGPFRRGLDLGSGEGVVTQDLAAHCGALVSVDISLRALARQKERLLAPGRLFLQADAFRMAFRPGSFDLLLASEVLSYSSRRESIAAEWITWLRPGGLFMLVDALLPKYFHFDELLDLAKGLGTIEGVEPLSSKHVLAKLANRRWLPFAEWAYDRAMQWTRLRPGTLAKHVCIIGRRPREGR